MHPSQTPRLHTLRQYLQLARVDHWPKNSFMLLGALLAFYYAPELSGWESLPTLARALLATCLVSSSNYVLNELLDHSQDRLHPAKRERAAAAGRVSRRLALVEWLLLGALGLALGFGINRYFGLAAAALWLMGCVYNVPPLRTKELPYVDVLSESLNSPLRLLLGWHALVTRHLAPLSLLLGFWMLGAFFMATKRLAEYRSLGDPELASRYRGSFRHYDENRLLVSLVFYVATAALFGGIFIVRYKLELILGVPAAAGLLAYYLKLGLDPHSPVQTPEKLYRQTGFLVYAAATLALFTLLMYLEIPALYKLFNVAPSSFEPLWRLGG